MSIEDAIRCAAREVNELIDGTSNDVERIEPVLRALVLEAIGWKGVPAMTTRHLPDISRDLARAHYQLILAAVHAGQGSIPHREREDAEERLGALLEEWADAIIRQQGRA